MIPKGMLDREKWLSAGMESQDFKGAIVKFLLKLRLEEILIFGIRSCRR